MPRITLIAALAVVPLLTGCDANERNTDAKGFVEAGRTPAERSVLQSIATYRTTTDEARACDLVTQRFIDGRFEGEVDNCQQVQRTAERFLPDDADVQSVEGATARVLVDEPTATKSIYAMRREDGTWKIDAITEAK